MKYIHHNSDIYFSLFQMFCLFDVNGRSEEQGDTYWWLSAKCEDTGMLLHLCYCWNSPVSVLLRTASDSQVGTASSQYASCYPGTWHWAECQTFVPGQLPRTAACLVVPPERSSCHHLSGRTVHLQHMSENWVLCVRGETRVWTVGRMTNHWRNPHFAGHWRCSEYEEVRPER